MQAPPWLAGGVSGLLIGLVWFGPATAQDYGQRRVQVPVVNEQADAPIVGGTVRYTDIMDIDQQAHMLYFGDEYTGGVDIFDISGPDPVYVKTEPTPSGGA